MPPREHKYLWPFLFASAILLVLGGIIFQIVNPIPIGAKTPGGSAPDKMEARLDAVEQTIRYQAQEIRRLRLDLNWYIQRGGGRIGTNGRPVGGPPE